MSGEQQLERSVLEGKERDELLTIAEALSLKAGSRTKKADLVDQILRATGVEVGDAPANGTPTNGEDKPRRTRASRAKPAPAEASNGEGEAGSAAETTAAAVVEQSEAEPAAPLTDTEPSAETPVADTAEA